MGEHKQEEEGAVTQRGVGGASRTTSSGGHHQRPQTNWRGGGEGRRACTEFQHMQIHVHVYIYIYIHVAPSSVEFTMYECQKALNQSHPPPPPSPPTLYEARQNKGTILKASVDYIQKLQPILYVVTVVYMYNAAAGCVGGTRTHSQVMEETMLVDCERTVSGGRGGWPAKCSRSECTSRHARSLQHTQIWA